MSDAKRLLLGGALLTFSSILAILQHPEHEHRRSPPAQYGDELQRRVAVQQLQAYSDYIGFGGKFAQAGDKVMVMTGSDLCAEDFPQLIPPAAWAIVVDAGYETFRCSDGRRWIEIDVNRSRPPRVLVDAGEEPAGGAIP